MQPGWVRIIGGKWRGRRLPIIAVPDLRPTPDRVRETLFNWLAPIMPAANCLDLFAGSGVLGFEALSRGAKHVVMVDQSPQIIQQLQTIALTLKTNDLDIYCATVPEQLAESHTVFDVVFLDPPYQANLLRPTCDYLEEKGYLANPAYI